MKILFLFLFLSPLILFSQRPNDITWEYDEVTYIGAKIEKFIPSSKVKQPQKYTDSKISMRGYSKKMKYITIDIPNVFYVKDATIYITSYEEGFNEGYKLNISAHDSEDKLVNVILNFSNYSFEPTQIFLSYSDKTTNDKTSHIIVTDFKRKD
jgi:hypothetical protein